MIIRILGFFALGGAITLLILSSSGSQVFDTWSKIFIIATVLLLGLGSLVQRLVNARRTRRSIVEAKQTGRLRRALIVERRQTGLMVNEQPQIEFALLVDSPSKGPFLSKAREIVSLLDLHEVVPGKIVTVVHPEPEYADVYIVAEPAPATSRELSIEAAESARTLPFRNKRGVRVSTILTAVAALIGGAIAGPFIATPNVLDYVQLMFEGRTDEVHQIDHPVLWEPDELQTTLAVLADENGHDEVYSVYVQEVRLTAMAMNATGFEEITMQDHAVLDRGAPLIAPDDEPSRAFSLAEIDWNGVLDGVSEARRIVEHRGLQDPELASISVERESTELARLQVRVFFSGEGDAGDIKLDAEGNVLVSETFADRPEAEQATYLYDAEQLEAALREGLAVAHADDVLQVITYGDRLLVDVVLTDAAGISHESRVDYRESRVRDVTSGDPVKPEPGQLFRIEDVNWSAVMQAITEGQEIMRPAGVADTEPTHIIIQTTNFMRDEYELIARIYLSNEYSEGGYIEVDSQGVIGRVQGP